LSFHEKQNRFFAVSLVMVVTVAFLLILWLVNRPGFNPH
jgi:hypothetical protein